MKYINRQSSRYHYFRYPGAPATRLRGEPGSPEYIAHYEELLQLATTPNVLQLPTRRSVGRPLNDENRPAHPCKVFLPGSIGWAVERFVTNVPAFVNRYRPGTREGHRLCLDMVRTDLGTIIMSDLGRRHVRHYCAKIAETRGTARADQVRRCISLLWQFALAHLPVCKLDEDTPNPARGIGHFHEVRKPHEKWPPHVQRAFLDGAPDHLRLAFFLARYTAFRRSDLSSVKWSQYDEHGERPTIYIKTKKTNHYVPMFVVPELQELLAKTERKGATIITDAQGRPVSTHTLTAWVAKRLKAIGVDGLTLHGLRVTLATERAEQGATVQGMMALLGHTNPKQSLHYCRDANAADMIYDAMTAQRPKQAKLRRAAS